MRKIQAAFFLLLMSACFSQAQQNKLSPLLGSTQNIAKSDFCKKYKCSAVYDKQLNVLTHYVLTVEGQNPDFFERLGRTVILPRYDAKKQLVYAEIILQEDFKSNLGINTAESELIADFLYFSLGKKLLLRKDAFNDNYSPDVNDCFSDVRFSPKENDRYGDRTMFTGYVTLQITREKNKYKTLCNANSSFTDKNMYVPRFLVKLLNVK